MKFIECGHIYALAYGVGNQFSSKDNTGLISSSISNNLPDVWNILIADQMR